jgi:hypothetical protein
VTLTAPANVGANPFKRWRLDGVQQTLGQQTLVVSTRGDRTAVADYFDNFVGGFKAYGTGCVGTNGLITQTGVGTPDVGRKVDYVVNNGPLQSFALCVLGFSNTNWGGIPLPFPVPSTRGCSIYTEMVIAPVIAIDSLGVGTFRTVIPNDPSLITGHYFTQMWAIDLPANPLGMTFSNGVNTQIGGNR